MCVNVYDIDWYIIKHWPILTVNLIVYHYMPETILCAPDRAVNKTENLSTFMVFISQSGNETAI